MKRPPIYKPKRFQEGGAVTTDDSIMQQKLQEMGLPDRDIQNILRLPLEARLQVLDNLMRLRASASAGMVPSPQPAPPTVRRAPNTFASRGLRTQQRRQAASAPAEPSSLPVPPEPPSSPSPSPSLPLPPPMPARAVRREAARESITADDLNARVLRLTRGGAPQDEVDRRLADRMGIPYAKGGLVRGKSKGKRC